MTLEVGEGRTTVRSEGADEARQSARGDVAELGRADRSQSNDGSDSEGLHVD